MADLPYIQQRQEVSITGQDSTGDQVNYVSADANGNLLVKDYSSGSVTGGTAATVSLLSGGIYNSTLPTLTTGQQSALQLDSSGRLIANVNVLPADIIATGTLTAVNQTVSATATGGQATWSVDLRGNSSGWTANTTIVFEYSVDGINFLNAYGNQLNSVTGEPNNGTTGPNATSFQGSMAGNAIFRVRVFAYTSPDEIVATIRLSVGPAIVSINSALPAGSNVIGGITQSGTWNITNITGTITLPTGASTAANQTTEITSLQLIDNPVGPVSPGTAGTGSSLAGAIYNTTVPAATNGQQLALQADTRGALQVTHLDGCRATYSASSTAGFASAATATDIFTITGSATKTIRVLRIGFSAQITTAGAANILLVKRSAANSGGTSVAATAVPHDSTSAAATATVLDYTANPTTLGATVGTVRSVRLFFPTSGSDVFSTYNEFNFGDNPGQAIVLRGTTQVLAINLNGVTVTGGTWSCFVEWTEE